MTASSAEAGCVVESAVERVVMPMAAGGFAALDRAQGVAVAVAVAVGVAVSAVGCAAVDMDAGDVAVLQRTQGAAGAVAVAIGVAVSAVKRAVVPMAAGGFTALYRAQGIAVAVAVAVGMAVSAVERAVVPVTARGCAAVHGADRDVGRNACAVLGVAAAVMTAPAASMTAVGRDGDDQHSGQRRAGQACGQELLHSHCTHLLFHIQAVVPALCKSTIPCFQGEFKSLSPTRLFGAGLVQSGTAVDFYLEICYTGYTL